MGEIEMSAIDWLAIIEKAKKQDKGKKKKWDVKDVIE